jgi:hypothetical protein
MAEFIIEKSRNWVLAPIGLHVARFYKLIDLGTQPPNKWVDKSRSRFLCYFELAAKAVFDPSKGEQPYIVKAEYTRSLDRRANASKLIAALNGRSLRGSEAGSYNLADDLGKALLLNIVHEFGQESGVEYDVIVSYSPVSPGTVVPPQYNPTVLYSVTDGENEVFSALPDWVKNKIRNCEEWRGTPYSSRRAVAERNMRQATENALAEPNPGDCNDDLDSVNAQLQQTKSVDEEYPY